jgi:hypothetical protein
MNDRRSVNPTSTRRARPRKLTDRSFLSAWNLILSVGNRQGWQPKGVEWRKTRHSFAGLDHSFSVEVHSLSSTAAKTPWSVVVVVEHWWDTHGKPLKSATWAHRVKGSSQAIADWCTAQAAALSSTPMRPREGDPAPS